MKSTIALALFLTSSALAFQVSPPSSFTGRAASIYNARQLQSSTRQPFMGIFPPILRMLRLRGRGDATVEEATTSSDVTVKDEGGVPEQDMKAYLESVKSVEVESNVNGAAVTKEKEEEKSETDNLMQQVKDAGLAGIISYALWEFGFWAVSVPVCIGAYYELTGHWPDFTKAEDQQKLAAEAFAFVNFARFAVPLRIGLALSTTPWIEENVVEKYFKEHAKDESIASDADGDDSL